MVQQLLRLAVWLCCMAPLGACGNYVRSERPLFTAADEVGAVPLKAGLWGGQEHDCRFDPKKPLADWPSCAAGIAIGPGGVKNTNEKLRLDRVAAGDPMILQIADEDGQGYTYAAMEVRARDRRGRATAVAVWGVSCGPEEPAGTMSPEPASASPATLDGVSPTEPTASAPRAARRLFPGLVEDGSDCLAADPAAVRYAAAQSRTLADPGEFRWLRAGRR